MPERDERPFGDWIEALCSGDSRVLGDILRAFGPRIASRLSRRFQGILDAEDVEDVLATALNKLWRARAMYDPALLPLDRWFEQIARNVACDVARLGWQRARRLERRGEGTDLDVFAAPALRPQAPDDPPAGGDGEAMIRRVREVIGTLPVAQRRIIEADMACWPSVAPSEDLARELGIATSSVPVYRRRAMDAIRAALSRPGDDSPSVSDPRTPTGEP